LDHGILRCRGRINNSTVSVESKNLILLPSKHHVVNLIIKHYHSLVKHNGVSDTLNALRERFWVIRGRQTIKQVICSCVVCLKSEGLSYSCISPPDLPSDRVSDDPPFKYTGIDFAGPLYVHCKGSDDDGECKACTCLFTCASTRAIHLELTNSMRDDQFLLAFRRFVGHRGLPAIVWSDNAKKI